jgi:hypothetical protein
VIGIFPRAGHDFFRAWLTKLATAVFIKALYSLVIAIVVAVSAALTAATGSLGFLFAFGLQTLFFWALFIYRKQVTARLVAATTGGAHHEGLPRASVVQRGATTAAAPVTALVGLSRRHSNVEASRDSALGDSEARPPGASTATGAGVNGSSASNGYVRGANSTAAAQGPARRLTSGDPLHPRGRAANEPGTGAMSPGHSAAGVEDRADTAPSPHDHATSSESNSPSNRSAEPDRRRGELEPTPRSSHEDVMRRARELRERQRDTAADEDHRG